jgi:elongator complex protein 1
VHYTPPLEMKHSLVYSAFHFQATLKASPELFPEVIHPAALESRAQFAKDINEMRDQLRKQLSRACELRLKKAEEPGASRAPPPENNVY